NARGNKPASKNKRHFGHSKPKGDSKSDNGQRGEGKGRTGNGNNKPRRPNRKPANAKPKAQ
ncbi:ATP-dependent helicase, partial [Vibrio sinaloensis]